MKFSRFLFAVDGFAPILDNNGTIVVEYRYNAWGELLATTGTYATTLGKLNPFRYRGYGYDEESGLYYLRNRYYNPELQRFITTDNIAYLGADSSVIGYNLYTYCLNSPANRLDESGNLSLPNWAKVAIGAVATVAAVAVTVATGGAAAPVLVGVATNTIISGISGYSRGGVDGLKDGLANVFMFSGLMAFGSSLISAGVRAIKTAKQGITIGKNMARVNDAAGLNGTATYSEGAAWGPLKERYYNTIKRIFGSKAANTVSCACNKLYIKTMRRLGAVIYDSGLNGAMEAGQFYGMELKVVKNYSNLVRMY